MQERLAKIVIKIANGFKDVDNIRDTGGKENQSSSSCSLKPPRYDRRDRKKPRNISKEERDRDYGDTLSDKDLKWVNLVQYNSFKEKNYFSFFLV